MSPSKTRPLVGRSAFAEAVAATTPLLAKLAEEAIADHKRRDPQWSKFGRKAIEIVEEWKAAESRERREEEPGTAAETSKKKRTGASNDPDWAKRIAGVKVRRDAVEKSAKRKTKESSGLKWVHVQHGGGYGSSLKKGVPIPALDEDDEEELPTVRLKKENNIKIEDDDEISTKDKR